MPRWVKVFVITALALALLMIVVMLVAGGRHILHRRRCVDSELGLMPMPPALRRAVLAAHIVCSVGWLGAAAAYLALGVAAEVNRQPQIVRAAWIGMELSGWFVIIPLACLAYLTGLVLSLGTPWGLFKRYWVVIAFVLTTLSLAVLLLHMPSVSTLAGLARTADDAAARPTRR